ncbi:MAG: mandelate racemase/muconate lactonizing enzyme family protein [Firmicutes bacterium]|nr:mandelate racemase/muconate lactonizing enzyme family protein [Bacillota bacterium]
MRLAAVETFPLLYPLPQPYGDANGYKYYRASFLLRLTTEGGLSGWGEVTGWLPELETEFKRRIIPYLRGKNALKRTRLVAHLKGWHHRAAAGISMALTEIAAKGAGISICELWGGRRRDKVPVYASLQSYTAQAAWPEHPLSQAQEALSQGFRAIKVKIGAKTFGEDFSHIQHLQGSLSPGQEFMVDANQSFDQATARKWGRQMLSWENLAWFEEPLPIQQVATYKALRSQGGVAMAGGENIKSAVGFLALLQQGALDIIQPDPAHTGGLDEYRHILGLARSFGVRVSPHSFDGALSRYYALLAQACLPPWSKMAQDDIEPVEWDVMENPFTALVPLKPKGGQIHLPSGRGLGLELDEELICHYRWDGSSHWS